VASKLRVLAPYVGTLPPMMAMTFHSTSITALRSGCAHVPVESTVCPAINPIQSNGFHIQAQKGTFIFSGFTKTIFYNSANNLPIFFTSTNLSTTLLSMNDLSSETLALLASDISEESSTKLSSIQRKLLHCHNSMGHMHMAHTQSLAIQGFLGPNNVKLSTCEPPLCKACLHGKQHKCPLNPSEFHPIDASHLSPGDCKSGDQLENTHPGMIPTYKGMPTKATYHAGTLLVDHASRFLHFTMHQSTGVIEAIAAKTSFKLLASSFHRSIHRYHTDNSVFASKQFKESCISNIRKLPCAVLMPITKMASWNALYAQPPKVLEPCSSMQCFHGPPLSKKTYGLLPCNWLLNSITTHPHLLGFLLWKFPVV